jgi:hypothetical protein
MYVVDANHILKLWETLQNILRFMIIMDYKNISIYYIMIYIYVTCILRSQLHNRSHVIPDFNPIIYNCTWELQRVNILKFVDLL